MKRVAPEINKRREELLHLARLAVQAERQAREKIEALRTKRDAAVRACLAAELTHEQIATATALPRSTVGAIAAKAS